MKQKLTLSDFANLLSQREGVGRREAELFVRAFFDLIENGLEQDKLVKIKGLGTFKLVSVSDRESVNISTGERFQISGHTKVTFTPDNSMKELVNRPFAHFEAIDLNEETSTSEFDEIDEEMREAEEEEGQTEAEDAAYEEDSSAAEGESTAETEENSAEVEKNYNDAEKTTAAPAEDEEPEEAEEPQVTAPEPLHISELVAPQQEPQSATAPTTTEPSKKTADGDIVVTSPTPISSQAAKVTQPEPAPTADDNEPHTSTAGNTSNTGGGYVYQPVPLPKKRNCWRAAALTLATILLMALSYFAGYYRLLCPTCHEEEVVIDTLETLPAPAATTDTLTPTASEEKADTTKPTPAEKPDTATHPVAEKPVPQEKLQEKPAETPKRPATHTVKTGDNVYRIARKYYGSDSYAERIIKANNLKDANTITIGMELTLP